MTPKQLLNKLEKEMLKASPENKEFYTAMYEGAARMYELTVLKPMRKYYATHREHNREYQREYRRAYRAKKKADAEQIKKEVESIK